MISFVFSVIQLFFQIKVLIILPRALGLRHAQVIGRQGRRITGVARKHAVHRAERSAARPLLPQLLGKQDERQAAACQRVRDELRAVAEQIDGAGPLGKLRHERVDGDRAVVRQAGKLPGLQREYRVVDLLLPRVHAGAVDAVGVSRAARHRLERGHAVERQLPPPGKALGAGHADALAWFIDRYTAYVSTIVSNILGPAAASADLEAIASDVFFAFWTHAKEIRPGKAKAYLGSIARNKAKESTRKTGRELPLEDDMLVISSGTPERELEKREQAAYIRKAVLALREPEREIFLRYYYFYQPVSTIAEEMGLESANVKTKLFRGRKKLKEVLEKGGYFVEA